MSKSRNAVVLSSGHGTEHVLVIGEDVEELFDDQTGGEMLQSGITEGRIVHYRWRGECYAAIIVNATAERENGASLRVLPRTADPLELTIVDTAAGLNRLFSSPDLFDANSPYSVEQNDFTWHWPLDHKSD